MREIPINGKIGAGKFALVDDGDYELLMKFSWRSRQGKSGKHYVYAYINGRTRFMHRFILGVEDPLILVDHEDLDSLNNQRYNLREATGPENIRNQDSHNGSTSKYKGVHFNAYGKWTASISHNRVVHYLGVFDDEVLAAEAYNKACAEMHGKFARLNIIDGYTDASSLARKRPLKERNFTSKYKGVHFSQDKNKWVATLYVSLIKQIKVGLFDTELEAAICYNKAATHVFGINAKLNQIDSPKELMDNVSFRIPEPKAPKSSQYKGVSWIKSKNKWVAYIRINNSSTTIGSFDDELSAAKCYNEKALLLLGSNAKLNDV